VDHAIGRPRIDDAQGEIVILCALEVRSEATHFSHDGGLVHTEVADEVLQTAAGRGSRRA
jgi:hypothetical protein